MQIVTYADEPYDWEWLEPQTFTLTDPDGQSQELTLAYGLKAQYDILCRHGEKLKVKMIAYKMSQATGLPFSDCLAFAICQIAGPIDRKRL